MKNKIRVGIIGATGYTGGELLRLLINHPSIQITALTSEQSAGKKIKDLFPSMTGILDVTLEKSDSLELPRKADLFFLAVPHGMAAEMTPRFMSKVTRVIDLSADFRLKKPELYSNWYHFEHANPNLLSQAVYGLTEINRDAIKKASLVANPGCYPTSILLPLYPLLKEGIVDLSFPLIIDAKSGVSGAGRTLDLRSHFSEVDEGIGLYKTGGKHRHIPEIEQEIETYSGTAVPIVFTPHLIPIVRGMLCVIYIKLKSKKVFLEDLYQKYYGNETFIKILSPGSTPNPKNVKGSNYCHIGFSKESRTGVFSLYSAIDNLTKGAAGQAIQNMNLMFGFSESSGLASIGIFP
ncbi:MAG: N-acetyl-gamma-glutamyl-phosphate reductase [Nitrospirae bacterium]|nr:N-acetyl-gamma-glutamyl-phosphate reductase [Nitrospirota bacterium]MBI3594902.1 N-acetyl-gamma-glutamyl-phosphate reductase [Nitrospirota bacterium]